MVRLLGMRLLGFELLLLVWSQPDILERAFRELDHGTDLAPISNVCKA